MGTLTSDVASALQDIKRGRLDYRAEKGGNLMAGIGKVRNILPELARVQHSNE